MFHFTRAGLPCFTDCTLRSECTLKLSFLAYGSSLDPYDVIPILQSPVAPSMRHFINSPP